MIDVKKITPAFTDERGSITRVMDFCGNVTSVLFITSKKGSIRANHYHKKDMHYTYLVTGKFEYLEKELEKNIKPRSIIVRPGDLVKTLPKVVHAMRFLENSTILVLTSESRKQEKYESDTIRAKLV